MKKTLLAVALATSALSGQALAWTNGGTGGSFELGGTFTAEALPTQVWETQLGSALNLDGKFNNTDTTIVIPVAKDIPVLGARVADASGVFTSVTGSTNNMQINYGDKIDLTAISNGVGTLKLDVNDTTNAKIGTLEAKMTTVAVAARSTGTPILVSMAAPDKNATRGFSGGLPLVVANAIQSSTDALSVANKLFPDNKFNDQGITTAGTTASFLNFNSASQTFSAAYASGVMSGTDITITLDKPLAADTQWKATFPITISYS